MLRVAADPKVVPPGHLHEGRVLSGQREPCAKVVGGQSASAIHKALASLESSSYD